MIKTFSSPEKHARSQAAGIFEKYLRTLSDENWAMHEILNGGPEFLACIEDALTVILLTEKQYPASVPIGIQRLVALLSLKVTTPPQSSRVVDFLHWVELASPIINESSKTSEYVPVFPEVMK